MLFKITRTKINPVNTLCAYGGLVTRSLSLTTSISLESERGEMVATLQTRREALEAKIVEKTAELKRLCLEEADLTGVLPLETPLEPGEPPPTIRRRVGTSFSFPQSLINGLNGGDDASLGALELECQVQTNIAEAALAIANDAAQSKSVRRKHRLMYRQSQRHLMDLGTRLSLLKQGKHQPMKPQQIKKKPRPSTTAVDHLQLMREFKGHKLNGYSVGSLPVRSDSYGDDELRLFNSLNRPPRSSGTSQSSNSPSLSSRELAAFNRSGLPELGAMVSSLSQPNIQETGMKRRSSGRRQWDSQSAGGTLLPNQTYPESHQPNLNRAQSLGSVDGPKNKEKEKEWYETALDSAPSPPLRTSSRLPTTARMLYHMQEVQIRDAVNSSLVSPRIHPQLTRTHRATPVDEMTAVLQGMRLGSQEHYNNKIDQRRHVPETPRHPHNRPHSLEQGRFMDNSSPTVSHLEALNRLRNLETEQMGHQLKSPPPHRTSDAVYIDIPEDAVDSVPMRRTADGTKTPTQPYYHNSGGGGGGPGWSPSIPGLPEIHPPHAVTHEEITFDTVVPFESPQNHTVVQAGIWQPYREVTKPFEMSDFYKYSTKFRQARQTPERKPDGANTLVGVYQPLRPQTCQPVERRPSPTSSTSVSAPKIV